MSVQPLFRVSTGWRKPCGPELASLCLWLVSTLHLHFSPHLGAAMTIFVSATLSSIVGFAFSPIAGAVLFYIEPSYAHTAQIMLIVSISIQIHSVYYIYGYAYFRSLAPVALGGLSTLPVGLYLPFNGP